MIDDFTVVIPSRDGSVFIRTALNSCFENKVLPSNIIVVLDGPDSAAVQMIRDFSSEIRFVELEKSHGAPFARNLGLRMASTPYIMFLDVDDYVSVGLVAGLRDALRNTCSDVAFGSWRALYHKQFFGRIRRPPICQTNADHIIRWLTMSCVPPCAVGWKTSFVRAIGGWDESLMRNQDGEIAIRGLLMGANVAISEMGCGVYVKHSSYQRLSQGSALWLERAAEVIYRQLENSKDNPDLSPFRRREFRKYCRAIGMECLMNQMWGSGRKWMRRTVEISQNENKTIGICSYTTWFVISYTKRFLRPFYGFIFKILDIGASARGLPFLSWHDRF